MKICTKCKQSKSPDEFYASGTHSQRMMCYCKDCFNEKVVIRWIDRKIQAITYKGGRCVDCKLTLNQSHYSVFEFHHLSPVQKDYNQTKLRLRSWASVKTELDKCVLVCANRHRMRHANLEEFAEFDNIPMAVSLPLAPTLKEDALSN